MVLTTSGGRMRGCPAGFRLFFSERDSDVAIRVEWEGQRFRFPGHQLILSTMSDVFRTMLDADMIEKNTRTITIKDSNPLAVKSFLKYLYTGIVEFQNWTEAANLLKLAHKYSVQALVTMSESYLTTQLAFSNACALFELGRTYSLKLLRRQAATLVLDGAFVVGHTEGFLALKGRSMESFISDPSFNAEGEGQVLNCLKEWATAECVRKCVPLSRHNVLSIMEPFLKHIRWNVIPEQFRTFVPTSLVTKYSNVGLRPRKPFYVPSTLQNHICYVRLVVELGGFHETVNRSTQNLCCVRFTTDNHLFLCGFRMVGLFEKPYGRFLEDPTQLSLMKDGTNAVVQLNLNSLPWTRGTTTGKDTWREMIAYLPYPIRLDPFSTYNFNLCTRISAKWPKTRLDSEIINTNLGCINFKTYSNCFGLTQLFVLPAPPCKLFCLNE